MIDICLAGASFDSANLGVSALAASVVQGVLTRLPDSRLTLFDFGAGRRCMELIVNGEPREVTLLGAKVSRRLYRPDNLWHMRAASWLGGLGNSSVRAIAEASAFMDISGGDSFTDLYGLRRFHGRTLAKLIALEQGTPLILLPQTYGPFTHRRSRAIAQRICQGATMAWARDPEGFEALRELTADAFDPARHRNGVDVAFALPSVEPACSMLEPVRDWLDRHSADPPLVGVNVSGLIYNDPEAAVHRYQFRANYRECIHDLVRRLVEQAGARVLLVPHVVTPVEQEESDIRACQQVFDSLSEFGREHLRMAPVFHEAQQVKWLIRQCDWFCGTRMHATIAALSSGVPAAAVAYSVKTQGVFDTCNQGEYVADPRQLDTAETVEALWQAWCDREHARVRLEAALPSVRQIAESQLDAIVQAVTASMPSSSAAVVEPQA